VFESTAAIYNGKVVDTGAKELTLTHLYMNSNLFLIALELGSKIRTHLSKIIVIKHHIN
jgi:hypothetical protein